MSGTVGISNAEMGDAVIDVLKQQVAGLTDLSAQYLATSRKLGTELQTTQKLASDLQERLTLLQGTIESQSRAIDTYGDDLEAANDKIAAKERELQAQAEAILELQRTRDEGYERINELEGALERGAQINRATVFQPAGTEKLIGG